MVDNPAASLKGIERPDNRRFTPDELSSFFVIMEDGGFSWELVAGFKLQLLTLCSPNEILSLRRSFLRERIGQDWRYSIVLPPSVTENGLQHEVPLSAPAWAIVEKLIDGKEPKERLLPISSWKYGRACQTVAKKAGQGSRAPFNFRVTAREACLGLGVDAHTISSLLNQPPRDTAEMHYQYSREPIEALRKLGDYMASIGVVE